MSAPEVRYNFVEAHIGADPAFTKEFGQRVKDCGGKYTEIRGSTNVRYVTIPSSEGALLDEIVAKANKSKITLVLRDFTIDGTSSARAAAVVRQSMGSPVCYWSRKTGSASEFALNFVKSRVHLLPWAEILATWAEEDRREEQRLHAACLLSDIENLKDRIAYEAARIAEGANDWETIRELGAQYSELCAEAGVDLSQPTSAATVPA
ncbi:hypothetical protein G6L37_00590 [Agrobacterium rubi]|nr:hypothetical protein [Agrobacterium rubi]NTF23887.1 hypothetical protein [Agrobacterium rubi]